MRAIVTHIEYSPSRDVTFVRCRPEESFSFKEGQFMMISSDHIHPPLGKPLKKPYSIATTNQELQEKGTIGFIVKKVCDGFMSEYLTHTIALGDTLHLQGPFGHMYRKYSDTTGYLLVSVGSGLSPMIGLYHSIVTQKPNARIAHLFGERFHEHVLPSIDTLLQAPSMQIYQQGFLSRDEQLPAGRCPGYVHKGIPEALSFLHGQQIEVFLCGKPEMVDEAVQSLLASGVARNRIQYEKY